MTLWPNVKKFIEFYIRDIEDENIKYILKESQGYFNDVEFNQFYNILNILDYEYDIDQFIDEIINEIYKEIIKENDGEYICIENVWNDYSSHYFGNKEKIIKLFNDFEDWYIQDSKHYCKVYDD